jgi:hypothetical protein
MKIKPVTLEVLEDAIEGNSSIKCGDWLYHISPSITNLSRRTNEFWTKGMEVVKLRYEDYLKATPIERLTLEFPAEDIEVNPVYENTRSTITEMILKAIPKDLASEATTKRLDNPLKILLLIMIKYQPGGRKEREAILKDITNPEACWYEDKALEAIRTWKRRLSRAKELKLIVPDPSVLLSALDNITEKVIKKDSRKTFRIETLREQLKIDVLPTSKAVEDLTKFIEAELEESLNTTTIPKVKSLNAKDDQKQKGGKNDTKGHSKGENSPKVVKAKRTQKEKERKARVNRASISA